MKPAVDEMFPEGAGPYVDLDEAGGSSGLLMDLAANEKAVHSDFFNGNLGNNLNFLYLYHD
uniref:COP9 signalosome complex subunit 9 n=1 Tax=Sander lucioperca TaxID=283035 RepID=A0A8C9ZER1_SANLU